MYNVTLKFPMADNQESSHPSLEDVHTAITKQFPNAVYSDLNNHIFHELPPDETLTLIWRNEKKCGGRYGTGTYSNFCIGWIFRDDITKIEEQEMWEKFSDEDDEQTIIRLRTEQ